MRGSYPPINYRYSRSLRDLVASMLNVSASSRPSLSDVLKMPFIKKHIYNFVKDIAARSSGIGEGTAVFKAAAVRVAEGARDGPPAMGGIGRFLGAGGLGPQAEALVRQLEKLGLERVVAKALSLEEPAAQPAPSDPKEARKQIIDKQNELNREEERRKAVEAALARLRSEKEARQKQRDEYLSRQRRRARPGRYDAERKLREKERKMKEAAARRKAHINAHRPSARDRRKPPGPSRPPGFSRRSSDQSGVPSVKPSPPRSRVRSVDQDEERELEEDRARREQAARAIAARKAKQDRERAERAAQAAAERQRYEEENGYRQRRSGDKRKKPSDVDEKKWIGEERLLQWTLPARRRRFAVPKPTGWSGPEGMKLSARQ